MTENRADACWYSVWRRQPDGLVSASNAGTVRDLVRLRGLRPRGSGWWWTQEELASFTPRPWVPGGWTHPGPDGSLVAVTFELLLWTTDWEAARLRISAERKAEELFGDASGLALTDVQAVRLLRTGAGPP
jgi:hypothetical protein